MRSFIQREPSAVLLAVQLLAVLLYPALEGSAVQRSLFSLFGVLVLGLVVLAVRDTPFLTSVVLLLGVPATVLLLIQAVTGDDALLAWSSGLEAAIYFYAAGAMIAYMLADHEITRDELFAVGAAFTLAAWGFAYVYTVVQEVDPGALGDAHRSWMDLLFLSFTTLTSTGLSDIVPTAPFARSVNMLQQIAGLGYVAMVVSRLVALTVRRPAE